MKKLSHTLILFFFISLCLSASGRQEEKKGIEITDTTENTVILESLPERLTFMGKSSITVADALYMFPEAQTRIVGVGNTNQGNGNFTELLDSNYSDKTYLEHTVGPEQVAVTRPDLVILKNYLKKSLGSAINQLDIPVLYLNLESPEYYEKDFTMLGQVFGNPERAEEIIQYYKSSMDRVISRTENLSEKPGVLFLYHSIRDGVAAFNIPPESWIQTRIIEMAGGYPLWLDSQEGDGWNKVSLEQIAAWDPDQIYVVTYKNDVDEVIQSMEQSSEWTEFRAVKSGHLKAFPVDYYSWDQPDSRWILGLNWLAKEMHPQLFADVDMKVIIRDFYKDLYFLNDEQIDREIGSRLGW
jgi:iron complex transport system substrate-binding protein